jgi:hypothetical protein
MLGVIRAKSFCVDAGRAREGACTGRSSRNRYAGKIQLDLLL